MENLKQIAKQIIEKNPLAIISGSVAINLQGYLTRREPSDIDIWIPENIKFIPLEGMVYDGDSDHYEEVHHHRKSYIFNEVKIDTFTPVYDYKFSPRTISKDGIRMLEISEILKFKIEHSFDEYYEDDQLKHIQDLVFILNQKIGRHINPLTPLSLL